MPDSIRAEQKLDLLLSCTSSLTESQRIACMRASDATERTSWYISLILYLRFSTSLSRIACSSELPSFFYFMSFIIASSARSKIASPSSLSGVWIAMVTSFTLLRSLMLEKMNEQRPAIVVLKRKIPSSDLRLEKITLFFGFTIKKSIILLEVEE